jgi:hypothetical protein
VFSRPTVFVLGAGASAELAFPLGIRLRDQIRDMMTLKQAAEGLVAPGVDILGHLARTSSRGQAASIEAANTIESGLPYFKSIDDFLDHHRENELIVQIGKMAIARAILQCEESSVLARLGQNGVHPTMPELGKTWYFKFVQMLVKDRPIGEVNNVFKNVTFITFNYDRSLEIFLLWAVAEAYNLGIAQVAPLVRALPIFHVYGSVGQLPELMQPDSVRYGERTSHMRLEQIAGYIQTYTESLRAEVRRKDIAHAITNAAKIIYLGCGFHKQNLSALKPTTPLSSTEIIATVFDIAAKNKATILERLVAPFEGGMSPMPLVRGRILDHLYNGKCTDLFDEYALGLMD